MGQVPAVVKSRFLIIGSGRLGRHLRHYFQLLGLEYSVWSRQESAEGTVVPLQDQISDSQGHCADFPVTHLLWAISDDALQAEVLKWTEKRLMQIHFSGSRTIQGAYSAHPLMTFPSECLWELSRYRRIPFAIDPQGPAFEELLPGLPNPSFSVNSEQKALYHAYCVMAGNFTTILWQSMIQRFESNLHVDREILFPYLDQITENLKVSAESALTGPLVRQDLGTIEKNLNALDGDPVQGLYLAFRDYFKLRKNL